MNQVYGYFRNTFFLNTSLFTFFAALTFVLYYTSLNNFYVLDDFVRLRAASDGSFSENFHFFPLPLMIYHVLYLLFGNTPVPLRILNYLLNAVMCVILFRFSFSLLKFYLKVLSEKEVFVISFFSSLLFCVHYIHVETIVYYSELHEMLYSLFYLLGLYYYLLLKTKQKQYYLLYVYLFFICSILSKETAVTFLLCIFLAEKFIYKSSLIEIIKKFYPLVLVVAAFAALRYFYFPSLEVLNRPESIQLVASETLKNFVFSYTAFFFSLDFIHIKELYKLYDRNLISTLSGLGTEYPWAIAGVFVSFVILIFILIRKRKVEYTLFLFSMITISSYAWLAGYERYLYLPSAGLCILVTIFMFNTTRFKMRLPILIIVLAVIYNIYFLKEKESHWITASEVSERTIKRILELTLELPAGSKVYFSGLPGEYKSAWILRSGIHEVPGIFLDREDIEFYYIYQKPEGKHFDSKVYVYDHDLGIIYKE